MKADEKSGIKTDKTTDFSFYVLVVSLGIGFIVTLGYLVYSFFE